MVLAFTIQPETYTTFEDETEQLEQCKEWGLLSEKAAKTKAFTTKQRHELALRHRRLGG